MLIAYSTHPALTTAVSRLHIIGFSFQPTSTSLTIELVKTSHLGEFLGERGLEHYIPATARLHVHAMHGEGRGAPAMCVKGECSK